MLLNVVLKKRNVAALVAACSMLCSAADADLFVAFAGKYPAQVLNIESAQIVYLEADIWTGSARRFRVTLPRELLCRRTLETHQSASVNLPQKP